MEDFLLFVGIAFSFAIPIITIGYFIHGQPVIKITINKKK